MKKNLLIFLLINAIAILMFGVAVYVPIPVPPDSDFQVLYQADQGILNNISLYDRDGLVQMLSNERGVPANQIFVLSFPYPPWYALSTLPLALLPVALAARMWFLLNFAMLLISVWLLSDQWKPHKRLWLSLIAGFFLPVFGALFIGQYVFPTILGISLLIYALRKQNIFLVALGMALSTFKPHMGLLVIIVVFAHLLVRRDDFGRRAALATVVAGFILFAVGFIADKAWPFSYFKSLLAFRGVLKCDSYCVSLSLIVTHAFGWGFDHAVWVAIIMLIVLIGLFIWSKPHPTSQELIASFVLITLLVNPYLLNYDFSFLLIPMIMLTDTLDLKRSIGLLATFLLPWYMFSLFGREGNSSFLVSAILLFVLTLIPSTLTIKK